jgi:hypothetical protein
MRHRGPIAPSIFKRHPLTGEPIEPVGIVGGKCVWPIMGGAPDPDDDDDDDDDTDDGDDTADGKDKDSGSDGDKDEAISKADYEAALRRMKAADKRADEAEKKVKAAEDADKDALTKATDLATELEKENATLQSEIRTLRLNNAFLTANTHAWHDPEVALDLAQAKGYIEDDIIDEEGKVDRKRLKGSLDRLAKEKPFLVQAKKKSDDDGNDDDKHKQSSGEPAGGRSDNGKDDRAKKQQLRGRFPVLNR